jgi:hypothetical protein
MRLEKTLGGDIACSWFAVKMQQAKRQREAVEAVRKLGGN